MRKHLLLIFSVVLHFPLLPVFTQVPFNISPSWISTDLPNYSTGAAWADINNDGWLDLVVANGNDMARERVVVYYNTGTGSLPTTPDWQSSDVDYHGHLTVGDINNDGFIDVAVSVYIGPGGFSTKGKVKLYLNNNGTLSDSPDWISKDSMYTFSCSFGDADGDGDLDLAVACGESYYHRSEQSRIYYNIGGRLDSLPGWKTQSSGYSYDVAWADFDRDGDLDLVFANEYSPNRIYLNDGDSIQSVANWSSTDTSQFANSLFVADVDNDSLLDLAVSDNKQLGGSGKFKIYKNRLGTLDTIPFWSSAFSGLGSGITLADIDNDGDRDLITGGWWQPCRIYMNNAGTFNTPPQWISNTGSVVEAIVCGDYDNDGLDTVTIQFTGDGIRKLYYLSNAPVHRLLSVTWNDDPDSVEHYCIDLENGWIGFRGPASSETIIEIRYVTSHDLDFVVSNWDASIGNYVFNNLTTPVYVVDDKDFPQEFSLAQNYPNPFNPSTTISYQLPAQSHVTLKVFDVLGREIATLVSEKREAGRHEVEFHGSKLPSGIYFYRLQGVNINNPNIIHTSVKKLMYLK